MIASTPTHISAAAKAASYPHSDPRPLLKRTVSTKSTRSESIQEVIVNLAESPLSWLHARGHVTDIQRAAGEFLRSDYERAQLGPKVTMRWEGGLSKTRRRSAPRDLFQSEAVIAAKLRFDGAMSHLGSGLSDIAWRVICAGETMGGAERELNWPRRSAKLVLGLALDRLAAYYKLP